MKIFNCGEKVANMEIDFTYVISDNLTEDNNSVMLLYKNINSLAVIKELVDDTVNSLRLSWKESDYKKSRVYFYISNGDVSLSVEAFPKYFSAKEQSIMLASASQDEGKDGWSDYLKLTNMFDDIDEILNCSYPVGYVGVYRIELTCEEKNRYFL